jgi:hypothetical protein
VDLGLVHADGAASGGDDAAPLADRQPRARNLRSRRARPRCGPS